MTQAPIPFANQQASGLQELAGASPIAANVVVDATGTVSRRPGMTLFRAAPAAFACTGLYVTNADRVFGVFETVGERAIYDLNGAPFRLAQSGGAASGLNGTARPVFAETEMIIAVAGGADMQKIVLGPPETTARLGGSPPQATHVVANQSRLLANDLAATSSRTIVRFSGIAQGTITYAGLEQWTLGIGNSGNFTAEADPDPIMAVAANSNEVFAFGSRTLQVFGSDPTSVFAPISSRELGMGAAYSLIPIDQNFHWLDNRRRFVLSDGRQYQELSQPIKRTLDNMGTVSDCFGYRVFTGPLDALVWTFPSDGRTFAMQQGGGWSEWLGWNGVNWTQFPVTSYAYRPATGQHLVGLSDGRIGALSLDATTDIGNPIRAYVQTGYLNHGTDAYKECLCVNFAFRRGTTQDATGPQAFVWWSDRPGDTMDKIPIDLGASGDTEIVWPLHGLGTYRRRAWFFEFAGTEQLTLVSATEEFAVTEEYGGN